MKDLKVRTKLILAFAIVLVLFIASVLISLFGMQSVRTEIHDFYTGAYEVRALANEAEQNFEAAQKNMLHALVAETANKRNSYIQSARDASSAAAAALNGISANAAGASAALDDMLKLLPDLQSGFDQVLTLAEGGLHDQAIHYTEETYMPLADRASGYLASILDKVRTEADAMMDQVEATELRSQITLIAISVVSALVAVAFCLYITASITKPIEELKAAAAEMTQGNLQVTIAYHSGDELGNLADSIREVARTLGIYVADINRAMRLLDQGKLDITTDVEFRGEFVEMAENILHVGQSLNTTMVQIKQSADQVASGSGQVASGAQALAQGATEQASSVEELAASINQISAQVRQNAETADELNRYATEVGASINSSNRQMHEMTRAMQEISESSIQIGKIIKTIEDIAFQTNILALNAAVEAARAGEAGKGFAVVADEVRNLATKSDEAAKSTTALIESTMRAVENGTEIATATASSLEAVVRQAQEITDGIAKITQASDEQAEAITQVTLGVDQISTVVQTNSATAEESAATSEELSGQARLLDELLEQFSLRVD